MASWNVRGFRCPKKIKSVLDTFRESKYIVLNLQETWHTKESLQEVKAETTDWCHVIHSQSKENKQRGEGVITLIKKENGVNAQPILAAIHTKYMVATLMHLKHGHKNLQKVIVINYYG